MSEQYLLYALLVAYLSFLLFFAWRLTRGGKHSSTQYLFGSGFGFFLSFLGISASLFSTFTLQGMPAFFRNHGIASWVFLGVTDVALAGLLLFFGLKMRRFTQALAKRNNSDKTAKNLTEWLKQSELPKAGVWFFVVAVSLFMLPYITIQIKGAAILLQSAIPLGQTQLLWSVLIVTLMLGYSWFGGIRAIFITDAVQGMILLVTVWAIAAFAIHAAGGIAPLFAEVDKLQPALLSAPGPAGLLNWQFLLLSFISIVLMPYVQPQLATRVLVAKSDKAFALSTVALGVFAILVILPTLFIGLRSVALTTDGDFLLHLIRHDAPSLFYALFIVGVLAAAMSTADSQLLAIGTEWSSALLGKDIQQHPSARVLVKSIGAVVALVALALAQSSFKSLVLFAINSFIGTSLLLPIVLASLLPSKRWQNVLLFASMSAVVIFIPVMLGILPKTLAELRVELWLYAALATVIVTAFYQQQQFLINTPSSGARQMAKIKEQELKQQGKIARLTNKTFKFDQRIGEGWFSAVYFLKTTQIATKCLPKSHVTMQFFQKKNAVLCGIDEAVALLHCFAREPETLNIHALHDGDNIAPYETVLTIEGEYEKFGYLEGLIDGILARRTSVATNVYNTVQAAKHKHIIFMGDRDDHFSQQAGDGYAAFIGGSSAQATYAMNEWWGEQGMGTMPHALIQLFGGDLLAACHAYRHQFPNDNLVALVDYHNNAIADSLAVAREFGKDLYGVRVDTSQQMIDQYFLDNPQELGKFDPRGVNKRLIQVLRKTLDEHGFSHVKIIVSGGFDVAKIRDFENDNTPVDAYGVGSSLIKVNIGFTGDCVLLNGKPQAKSGRGYLPNPRLQAVAYQPQSTL